MYELAIFYKISSPILSSTLQKSRFHITYCFISLNSGLHNLNRENLLFLLHIWKGQGLKSALTSDILTEAPYGFPQSFL